MNAIFLIIIIAGCAIQAIAQKEYDKKTQNGVFTFSASRVLFAISVFALGALGGFEFSKTALIYSILFAIAYSSATVFSFLAISSGPFSITNLVSSYSLIVPATYGILMLGEPISLNLIIGIILLLVSLVFVNLEKKGEPKKITFKWIIYALLAFVGNGACSTVQRVQQINCNGKYKNEFMIVALVISFVVLAVIALVKEKKKVVENFKIGAVWSISAGVFNGVVNLLVILLAFRLPASVMFPIISAGGIITSVFVAVFLYKEKLTKEQIIGFVLGSVSVVFLNL